MCVISDDYTDQKDKKDQLTLPEIRIPLLKTPQVTTTKAKAVDLKQSPDSSPTEDKKENSFGSTATSSTFPKLRSDSVTMTPQRQHKRQLRSFSSVPISRTVKKASVVKKEAPAEKAQVFGYPATKIKIVQDVE